MHRGSILLCQSRSAARRARRMPADMTDMRQKLIGLQMRIYHSRAAERVNAHHTRDVDDEKQRIGHAARRPCPAAPYS